jgi:hypothetical protein
MQHWKAVKHLLRYLKGTIDFRLEYGPYPSSTELFTTFSDADFGGNKDTGQSTGGYMVCFGTGAVSWQSKLQPFVVLFPQLKQLKLARKSSGCAVFFQSWGSLLLDLLHSALITNLPLLLEGIQNTTEGLDLRHFWLRNAVEDGHFSLKYVSTNDMSADILTKALPRSKVAICCGMMGLR